MISQKAIEMEQIGTRTLHEMVTAWAEQSWDGVQYKRIAVELWDSIGASDLMEGPYGDSVTLLESCIVDSAEGIDAGLFQAEQAVGNLKKLLENDDFVEGARIIEVCVNTNPVCRISNIDGLQQQSHSREPPRKLRDEIREHQIVLLFGFYIGMATALWLGYFEGYISLERVLPLTLGGPLLVFGVYYLRKVEHQMTLRRITIVCVAGAFGFPIWLFLNYVLYVPTWAPFHGQHGILNTVAFVLSTVLSYYGVAYLVDRLGRRGYWPGELKVCGRG